MHPPGTLPLRFGPCLRCGETHGLEYVDIFEEMENEIR